MLGNDPIELCFSDCCFTKEDVCGLLFEEPWSLGDDWFTLSAAPYSLFWISGLGLLSCDGRGDDL